MFAHNWLAFQVWADTWNQWRQDGGMMARRVGMDWIQVEAVMRLREIPRRERKNVFAALRIMEAEALNVIEEQLKTSRRRPRLGRSRKWRGTE